MKAKIWTWLKNNMPGLWSYCPAGGAFGRGGVPDRINLWRGVFFAIEAKTDRDCTASDLQKIQLKKIKKAGGISIVMYGFEEHKLKLVRDMILERTKEWVDVAGPGVVT